MKIKLTRTVGGHAIGDTLDRNAKVAQHLINAGVATEAEHPKPTKADDDKPKAKQTRRSKSRDDDATDGSDPKATIGEDKPAGQRGGGVPPRSPSTTAG